MIEREENGPGLSGEIDDLTSRALDGLAASAPLPGDALVQQAVGRVTARYQHRRTMRRIGAFAVAAAVAGLVTVSMIYFNTQTREPVELVGPARLEIARGMKLGLAEHARAVIDGSGERRLTLRLERGRVALRVPPEQHWNVSVVTALGLVEVKGTVFSVELTDDDLRVDVLRGAVTVKCPGAPAVMVSAGESLGLPAADRSPLDDETAQQIRELLGELKKVSIDRTTPEPVEPAEPTGPVEEESPSRSVTRTVKNIPKEMPLPEPPSPGELIRQARACRMSGDWKCAAERYRQVRDLYPGRPEAATALVLLAGIEIDQLDRPGKAIDHYRQYLGLGGKGALAVEAQYGICRAWKTLGRSAEERQALEDFVTKHPRDINASEARKRLEELSP